jgi:SAM-dependent methyltransferase
MPVDRGQWAKRLDLSNFINAYYQYRDLTALKGCRRVLIVGPGQGLDTAVLRWRGYEITTFDIDSTFGPDEVGSVHDLSRFADLQFDALVASHVLEHLPESYLDAALDEIARVARYAIIYLPVHGLHMQFRFLPGLHNLDFGVVIDLFNYFRAPDGEQPRYMEGQHYWEVGMRRFRVRDLVKRLSKRFEVLSVYRNKDWLPSQNFIVRSRRCEAHPATKDVV